MIRSHRAQWRRPQRAGFSLVEAVIATLLVGVLLVAATRAVGASVRSQRIMADRSQAACLADALISEIHQQDYMEPGASSSNIGRESGESSSSRSNWDDVDDYHGLTESPPRDRNGSAIPGLAGWERKVTVRWVSLNDITSVSGLETGVKRIMVSVSRDGRHLATRVMIRTQGRSY